jgi:hypothetical protein
VILREAREQRCQSDSRIEEHVPTVDLSRSVASGANRFAFADCAVNRSLWALREKLAAVSALTVTSHSLTFNKSCIATPEVDADVMFVAESMQVTAPNSVNIRPAKRSEERQRMC